MFRMRTWLLTMAAVLWVAAPAVASFWPAMIGLPFVFGPKTPLLDQDAASTTPAGDSNVLSRWHELWQQGRFREALSAAQAAAQAAPEDIEAQHALVISQLVNSARAERPSSRSNSSEDGSAWIPFEALWFELFGPCPGPGDSVAKGCTKDRNCCECPLSCFLTALLGGQNSVSKPAEASPSGTRCLANTEAPNTRAECDLRTAREQASFPVVIWIVREAPGTPTSILPRTTSVLPPYVRSLVAGPICALPPPELAPPPPPLIIPGEPQAVIPVPVPAAEPASPMMPGRYTVLAEAESFGTCASPPATSLAGAIRIHQSGGRFSVTAPQCQAQCDRIHGGPNGELILEGNVRYQSHCHGQALTIEAQRVLLNTKTGQFVVEHGRGMEPSRINVAPIGWTVEPPRTRSK